MNTFIARTLVLLFLTAKALPAQAPQLINYQGRVAVNGVNFDGSGQFKFAIVNTAGTTSYWSNDGTSTAGSEPAAAVTLSVNNGNYSVLLGDTTLPNMAAIPAGLFNNSDELLRVWFNDGTNGSQLLMPDQRLQMDNPTTDCTDAWLERASGAPLVGRTHHRSVWTGSEIIIWGGNYLFGGNYRYLKDGGRYNPAANNWTAMSTSGAPAARILHTAVWTGNEMIVWGGANDITSFNNGGRYNPAANSWTPVSTSSAARAGHAAVWSGSEMIVWGGATTSNSFGDDGGRYNPEGNSWRSLNRAGAPQGRSGHTAVWTGSEMIVWGGFGGMILNNGGRYNPAGDNWTGVNLIGAPPGRELPTAVWTGTEMIVWGGNSSGVSVNSGGRYNPEDDRWTAVGTTGAPAGRYWHTAVWTGSDMIVWGGNGVPGGFNDGGRYTPADNSWTPVTKAGAPAARATHTAVWTGKEMIVWGGTSSSDTFSYTPYCEPFRITRADLSSGNLTLSFPTVTGRTYTLWRSDTLTSDTWTNTGLTALTGTGSQLTFTVPVPTPAGRFFRVQADP